MDSTVTSTRGTTLLSGAPVRPVTVATVRPVDGRGAQRAAQSRRWQGTPVVDAFQGAAIAGFGSAAVTDLMVIDHKHVTRLGSSSCSPPV